jgi:hypothetical protein
MKKPLLIALVVGAGVYLFTQLGKAVSSAKAAVNVEFKGLDVFFNKLSFTSLPGRLMLSISNPSPVTANVQRISGNLTISGVQVGTFSGGPVNVAAYGSTGISLDFTLNVLQIGTAAGLNFQQLLNGQLPKITARGVALVNGVDIPFEFSK